MRLNIEMILNNQKHSDRLKHIPENQDVFINELSKRTGMDYKRVMISLPNAVSHLNDKEYHFIRGSIFNKTPIIDIGHIYHMSLNKTEEYYNHCINKLVDILKEYEK